MASRKRAFADLQTDQPDFEPDAYAQQGLPDLDYSVLSQNLNQIPFQGGQMVPYIQPGAFGIPNGYANTYLDPMQQGGSMGEELGGSGGGGGGDDAYPEDLEKRISETKAKKKKLPPFVEKVATFVNDENNHDIIRWSDDGDSFIVLDEDRFSKELIPGVFKHNNFASFVRQLNMYNFHKKVGMTDGSLKASMDGQKARLEYEHKYFKRGHPDMLFLIEKPKAGKKSGKTPGGKKLENVKEESDDDLLSDDDHYENDRGGVAAPRLIEDTPSAQNKHEFYTGSNAPQTGPSPVTNLKPNGPTQAYSSIVAVVDHIVSQINDLKSQQNMISTAITRLRQDHQQLAKQASAFQEMHDRHEMSISNILQFLASVYNKNIDGMNQNGMVAQPNTSVVPAFTKHPTTDLTNTRPAKRRRFLIEDGRGANGGGKMVSNFDDSSEDVRLQDTGRLQELDTPTTEANTPSVRHESVTPTPVPSAATKQQVARNALIRNNVGALAFNHPPVPVVSDHELRNLEQHQAAVDHGLKQLQQNVEDLAGHADTLDNFDFDNMEGFTFPDGPSNFDNWIAGLSPGSLQNVNEDMQNFDPSMGNPLAFDQDEIEAGVLNTHIDSTNGTPEPGQQLGGASGV